jgi:hypothetical protein
VIAVIKSTKSGQFISKDNNLPGYLKASGIKLKITAFR